MSDADTELTMVTVMPGIVEVEGGWHPVMQWSIDDEPGSMVHEKVDTLEEAQERIDEGMKIVMQLLHEEGFIADIDIFEKAMPEPLIFRIGDEGHPGDPSDWPDIEEDE